MHLIHKWEYYGGTWIEKFLGEEVERIHNNYRVCRVCEKAQEYCCYACDGGWETLSETKTKILKQKIDEGVIKKAKC